MGISTSNSPRGMPPRRFTQKTTVALSTPHNHAAELPGLFNALY
jgi:hypothetical protein